MEVLNQLVVGDQVNIGQFAHVSEANILDAKLTTPSGKLLSYKQKRQKANQFCFIGINTLDYMIGVAIVDLTTVSNGFAYVYDKSSNQLREVSRLNPLATGTQMPNTPNTGHMHFKASLSGDFIDIDFGEKLVGISVSMGSIALNAQLTPSTQPMCLCTKTGLSEFVYMQKQNALSCEGVLCVDKNKVHLAKSASFASIDWTYGYMRRETFWNWSSISACVEGVNLGLNLVCGVNETSYTENACWVDDTLFNLPLSVFDYDQNDLMKPWQIHSNTQLPTDRQVELTFTPKAKRSDHTDAVIIASHFDQLIGVYDGTIRLPERTLVLNNVWGLAEAHYAKW